jgi:hypothetical protein
LNISSIIIF